MPGRQRLNNPLAKLHMQSRIRPRQRREVHTLSREQRQKCEYLVTIIAPLTQHINADRNTIPRNVSIALRQILVSNYGTDRGGLIGDVC